MQDVLPEDGAIRKLWIGEAAKYRDHVLRLDSTSRHNRFGGGVSDDFIGRYVELSLSLDAVVHAFFIKGVIRGAAELRPLGAPGGGRDQRGEGLAESRRRLGLAPPYFAHCPQPRFSTAAHGLPRRQPAHAAAGAQIRCRIVIRLRQRGGRGRILAPHAVVADA
jgi:hypothetical protein